MDSFEYQGYYVVLKRKSTNKNTYLRLQLDKSILVTCPFHIKIETIYQYLDSFIKKITTKIDLEHYQKVGYLENETIYYLGNILTIEYVDSKQSYCVVDHDKLLVYTNDFSLDNIKKTIDKFLREQSESILKKRFYDICLLDQFAELNPNLKIRTMSRRFGACYYKRNQVMLARMLIHYDIECIDYVIVHELSHFYHPNHSKKFYYYISNIIPNYQELEAKLQNYL